MQAFKAQPLQTGAAAVYNYNVAIEKKLKKLDRFGEPMCLSKRSANEALLYVPRQLAPMGAKDTRTIGMPAKFNSTFKPRSFEQERVVQESTALLKADRDHIIEAPTGFGKTVVGAEIAARIGLKTLVIVPKEDIIKHWRTAFNTIAGVPLNQIGLIQADKCIVAGKSVCIAMVHSICKHGRYPAWVYKEFGLVIFDEVHVMGADTFSESAWLLPSKHRVGLSATPYRKDGKEAIFHAHIGQVLVKSDAVPLHPKILVRRTDFRVPMVWRLVEQNGVKKKKLVQIPHGAGKTMHINKLLAKDVKRNNLIVAFVWTAYTKDRNTVIFSDLREDHLDILYNLLRRKGVPAKDIAYYVGGMKESERERAIVKPVVLATYQMCSMATDVPWWDTAVLGTPRSDVKQIIGRIIREYEGKISWDDEESTGVVPVALDLLDDDSPVFKSYFNGRRKVYTSLKAKVLRVEG